VNLKERLNQDLRDAMRSGDTARRDTIRLLLTTIKNAEIEQGGELSEAAGVSALQKQAKQRRDSIAAFEQGGRPDLAEAEQAELAVIESYLPEQMDEPAIREMVQAEIERQGASGAQDIGKLMGPLMGKLRGRADGTLVQKIVRDELGA
jgi:uncharacterized protein